MLFTLNRVLTKEKRIFFLYALFTTILAIIVFLLANIFTEYKSYYFTPVRLHNILEFTLLSFIFYYSITAKIVKKIILFAIVPFIALCVVDYINSQRLSLAYLPLLIECLYFIILIIYFFIEKINQDNPEPFTSTFIFWLAVAFFIYFSGNFFLFVYSKSISVIDDEFKRNYTLIYSSVTILKNILLCIAVLIREKQQPILHSDDENIDDANFNYPINNLN